ncbi:MAG: putative dsRNA-binding protein [Candidatus Omnitrophica bacterium]|nr:putative dsRNA-binding protein [Candidatus Omnitrophota bacterium]MCM8802578.1 putative dsRNA-binding protein [Candidatus Omnitrophota bacterium]
MQELERIIGYKFKNKKLLEEALTHPSYSNNLSYERLEFLGDLILDTLVGIYLFKKHKDKNEDFLTNLKSSYVNKNYLKKICDELGIINFIKHKNCNIKRTDKFIESLIGALYLDGGWRVAERFIKNFVLNRELEPLKDYKSLLLKYSLKNKGVFPEYRVVCEKSSHDKKEFIVEVKIKGIRKVGKGKEDTIKQAELNAAKQLYEKLTKNL